MSEKLGKSRLGDRPQGELKLTLVRFEVRDQRGREARFVKVGETIQECRKLVLKPRLSAA
jgi:hypothetical protein